MKLAFLAGYVLGLIVMATAVSLHSWWLISLSAGVGVVIGVASSILLDRREST